MLSLLRWDRVHGTSGTLLRVFAVVAISFLCFVVGENLYAQQNSRAVYTTTNQNQQAVSTSQRVAATSSQVTPVPDFLADYSDDAASLPALDRLDRRSLPMLYHYQYEQHYQSGMTAGPAILASPLPQLASPSPMFASSTTPNAAPAPPKRNNGPADLDARLREWVEIAEGGQKMAAPSTPLPDLSRLEPVETLQTQPHAPVVISHRLGVTGKVAAGGPQSMSPLSYPTPIPPQTPGAMPGYASDYSSDFTMVPGDEQVEPFPGHTGH